MTDVPGVCFGSPVGRPLASREEAEKGALGWLALLGSPLQPADDYEPEDLDGWEPIRVNGSVFGVAKVTHEQLSMPVLDICRDLSLTLDELQIIFARVLLDDAAGHPVRCRVLTSLAPDEAKKRGARRPRQFRLEPCERRGGRRLRLRQRYRSCQPRQQDPQL
jgi:hypothetical protein